MIYSNEEMMMRRATPWTWTPLWRALKTHMTRRVFPCTHQLKLAVLAQEKLSWTCSDQRQVAVSLMSEALPVVAPCQVVIVAVFWHCAGLGLGHGPKVPNTSRANLAPLATRGAQTPQITRGAIHGA